MRSVAPVVRCALTLALAVPLAASAVATPSAATEGARAERSVVTGEDRATVSPRVRRAVAAAGRGAGPDVRVVVSPARGTSARDVLAALPDGTYDVAARFRALPLLALEIGASSLAALEDLPVTVVEDRVVRALDREAAAVLGSEDVQDHGWTGEGVTVAVADTGVFQSHGLVHPGLADDLVRQRCHLLRGCQEGPDVAEDGTGHGTHVAGIVTGPEGVAPDARIEVHRVLDDHGAGSDVEVLRALDDVVARNDTAPGSVDLVNLSLGGGSWSTQESCDADNPAYLAAVTALRRQGVAVLAATGNAGETDGVAAPACVSGVVGVGSSDDADLPGPEGECGDAHLDEVSCFTNLTAVQGAGELLDVVAPGCAYTSLGMGADDVTMCGTSMASPAAAGVAALALQASASRGDTLLPDQLEQLLEDTGHPVRDRRLGPGGPTFPRVDARAATGLPVTDLGTPGGLRVASQAPDRVGLAWQPVPGATTYAVHRTDADRHRRLLGRTSDPSYLDLSVPCGPSTYRVRAGTGTGLAAPAELVVTSRDCPARPTGLASTRVDQDTVTLGWAATDPLATGVVVERRRWGQPYADVAVLPAGTTSFTDSVDGCGVTAYRVVAVRGEDRSTPSLPVFPVACAPAHDLVEDAEPLPAGTPGTTTRRVVPGLAHASTSPGEPDVQGVWEDVPAHHSVWYRIEPVRDTGVTVRAEGTTTDGDDGTVDTYLAVYASVPTLRGTVAANDDVDGQDLSSRVRVTLRAGRTYFVQAATVRPLGRQSTSDLRLELDWSAPAPPVAGDELAGAPRLPVTGRSGKMTRLSDTHRATWDPSDPVHACGPQPRTAGSHTRWWVHQPRRSGRLAVVAAGSQGHEHVLLSVLRRDGDRLVPLACGAATTRRPAQVSTRVARGQRYVVLMSLADERPAWYGGWKTALWAVQTR